MSAVKDHNNKAKALPETGTENNGSNNATLFGGLFAALGSLLLFGRRKTNNMISLTRSVAWFFCLEIPRYKTKNL